jgi:hypothetical protein
LNEAAARADLATLRAEVRQFVRNETNYNEMTPGFVEEYSAMAAALREDGGPGGE